MKTTLNCLFTAAALFAIITTVAGQAQRLTPEQRQEIHGRRMKMGEAGAIPRLLASTDGDVQLRDRSGPPQVWTSSDPQEAIEAMICTSRGVVVARAGKPRSFMNADQGWVYTEWPFHISQTIKGKPSVGLRTAAEITVLRNGGTVLVNGRQVIAIPAMNDVPLVPGDSYLLFLGDRIAETGAFFAPDALNLDRQQSFGAADNLYYLRNRPGAELKQIAESRAPLAAARSTCLDFSN